MAMIKTAFGDESSRTIHLSGSVTFGRFKRFNNGRRSTEDNPRSGSRRSSRNDGVATIRKQMRNGRRFRV